MPTDQANKLGGNVSVSLDVLKKWQRDMDACQKVIWLAGGFDPAYCKDAQACIKQMADHIEQPREMVLVSGGGLKVHRYKVQQMLSEKGNTIGYDPYGPEIVMADVYDADITRLQAEVERLTSEKSDAAAIVDESDDGLFIDILYGENGSSLRRGDKLYTSPPDRGYVSRLAYEALQSELTSLQGDYAELQAVAWGHEGMAKAIQSELTKARELLIPDECPHIIMFDDADRESITFAGTGARTAALKTWEQISASWNAHLFVRVERNSRDDRYPSARQSAPASSTTEK